MTGRLRLREDFYYAATADGLYGVTHDGPVRITGADIAAWLQRLSPYFDGSRTLEELLRAVPDDRREFVREVVTTLDSLGVVTTGLPLSASDLSGEALFVARRWSVGGSEAVDLVARHVAASAFVIGSGPEYDALVRQVRPAAWSEVRTTAEFDSRWVATPGAYVLGSLQDDEVAEVGQVEDACEAAAAPAGHLLRSSGRTWLIRPGVPGVERPHLRGIWLRLSAMAAARTDHPILPSAPPGVLATQLAHAMFVRQTRPAAASASAGPGLSYAVSDVLVDGVTDTHRRVLPHPFTLNVRYAQPDVRSRVADLRTRPALAEEEFSARARQCSDAWFGVIGEIDEGPFEQLPLRIARCAVSDPVGLLGEQAAHLSVTGAGPDFASARYATARRALALAASLTVDPRRLQDGAGRGYADPDQDPQAALTRLVAATADGYLSAVNLVDEGIAAVPVGAVFPALLGVTDIADLTTGAAVSYTWDRAVLDGVLQHLRGRLAERADELARRGGSAAVGEALDLSTWRANTDDRLTLDLVTTLAGPIRGYDLSGLIGAPAVALCLDGDTAYGCGLDLDDALRAALQDLTLGFQSRLHGQPDYAPRGSTRAWPAGRAARSARPVDRRRYSTEQLVRVLAADGGTVLAAPLDHDPALAGLVPFAVKVVVINAD
jgi:hypothetical protein